jgi:coenzyme Q-binding protein COQ10
MPSFKTERRVPYTARQMFDVVADVENYPRFLPLCESLFVRERRVVGADTILTATMGVGYKAIRESFTTRVTLQPEQHSILVEYLDGPFRHLENRWRFVDQGPGQSLVDFYINYEFRSRALSLLVGAVFDRAFHKFAEAFEARAGIVYGRQMVGARITQPLLR